MGKYDRIGEIIRSGIFKTGQHKQLARKSNVIRISNHAPADLDQLLESEVKLLKLFARCTYGYTTEGDPLNEN